MQSKNGGPPPAQEKPTIDPLMPAIIGAELSHYVSMMETVLADFPDARYISRKELRVLRRAVSAAGRIAKYSQQVSRLAEGRLRQSHERLSLHELVAQVLMEAARRLRRIGVEVEPHLRAVEIIVDPGLLISLLETAVDWAAARGQKLQVWLSVKNWPEHAVLLMKARPGVTGGEPPPEKPLEDTLDWVLLTHIAQVMGVVLEREVLGEETILTIEFPRTVRQLEGLTAVEVDGGGNMDSETRPLAGHRLLLISDDESLKYEVNFLCSTMGIVVDCTPTTRQAVRFCELDRPHIILVDETLKDKMFDELRQDLLNHDVNFPFIEIAHGTNVVELSSWMGDRMSRISRDALRGQLPSIVAMELAKVS